MPPAFLKIFRSDIFLVLMAAVICFVFTYYFFGFYYVEYEGLHNALVSGQLSPGVPFDSFYFLFDIGLSYIYSALFTAWPQIDWKAYSHCITVFTSSVLGFFLIVSLLPPMHRAYKLALLVMIFYFLFAEHQIQFLVTRMSYVSAGISLIALVVLFKDIDTIRRRWFLFLCLNVFFTFATLTRVEPALAVTLLILVFALLYTRDLKQSAITLFYPSLLVLSLVVVISWRFSTSDSYHIAVEPEIETEYMEKGNMIPLSQMKTRRDSAIHEMARTIMWSDPQVLSPVRLRSFISHKKGLHDYFAQAYKSAGDIYITACHNWHLVVLSIWLGIYLFFKIKRRGDPKLLFYFLCFELSFWVLIFAQTYSVKLNDRSFVPFIDLFIFCHVLLVLQQADTARVLFSRAAIGFFMMLSVYNFYWLYKESKNWEHERIVYAQQFERIKKVARNQIVVLNNSSFDCFFLSNVPFHPFDFSAFKRVYIYDAYIIPFIPAYNKYLQQECHCDLYHYPDFWSYLSEAPDDVYVMFHPKKLSIVKEYQSELYHWHINLMPVQVIAPEEMIVYRLEKERQTTQAQ